MPRALVVDDSSIDREVAGGLLESQARLEICYAGNGREALDQIVQSAPDLVVTDLQMPEIDGLQLVEEIREKYQDIPVILMTAHGSEEIAAKALRAGAASYVPKKRLAQDLAPTIREVLAVAKAGRRYRELLECVTSSEISFILDNNPVRIPDLVDHLQECTAMMKLCDATGLVQLGIALTEAMDNALFHGNLEIASDLPKDATRSSIATERRKQSPYRGRHINVRAALSRSEAVFVIRDEGPGFDPNALPDPTDPANLEKATGRGVLLMRSFMSEVRYNDKGNEVTLTKKQELPGTSSDEGEDA